MRVAVLTALESPAEFVFAGVGVNIFPPGHFDSDGTLALLVAINADPEDQGVVAIEISLRNADGQRLPELGSSAPASTGQWIRLDAGKRRTGVERVLWGLSLDPGEYEIAASVAGAVLWSWPLRVR